MRLVLALCLLLLAACGTVTEVLTPAPAGPVAVSGQYWIAIQDRFGLTPDERAELFDAAAGQLGGAKVAMGTAGAMELRITVTNYRATGIGNRQAGGTPGGDFVESIVHVVDPASRRVLREERVVTRNRRAIGSEPLLREHGRDVVAAIAR
ncbi:hypothetical protein [Arenimonas composti]|uniref:DUF4410 domain-containing protein n=1 Tax=Arenimonas composti TR7-09 = DSM 18010 TaxID=1121013 RepID=A0A091BFQ8_9GAMM|nr:hypothetical protein [Arenimonas composti]KFN51518.1 hypothetical protein P873_00225 [Arenimonas composti TR7-09 = DSM 18010]